MYGGSANVRTIQTVFQVQDRGTATLRNAEESSDELVESLERMERMLGAVGGEATSTAAQLLGTSDRLDALGDDAGGTAVDVQALQERLGAIPNDAVASASSLSALGEQLDDVGGDATEAWFQLDNLNDKTNSLINSILPAAESSEALASELHDLAASSGRSAGAASVAASRVGSLGDEAVSTAGQILTASGRVDALGGDALTTAADIEALQERLGAIPDDAVASASSVSALGEELDDVGGDATEAWLQLSNLNDKTDDLVNSILPAVGSADTLSGELDEVASSARRSAVSASAAAGRIDELGDEALSTSAKMQALDHSTSGAATSSAGLTAALGPLRGRVSTLGPAFLAAAPAVAGLASSLGGVAIAAGTAGGALGGVFAGGLLQKAERMADANAAIADRAEALEKIFSNFKSELIGALAPIKTIANTQLVTDTFEGAVTLAGEFATSLAGIAPLVRDLARSMGSSVLATAPAIFDELEATVRTLGPALEGMVSSGIESLPTALRFFRSEAEQLLPELRSFGGSLIRTGAAVADFGSNILDIVLPALTPMIDLLGGVASASARLPKPLLAASGAATVATLAVGTYGGVASAAAAATGVLATALGVVTAPISALSVGVGALIGVLTFGAAKLGLFSAALNAVKGTISAVASGVQFGVNTFLEFTGVGERAGAVLGWFGERAKTVGAVTGQLAGVLGELLRIGVSISTLTLLAPFAALLKLPELPGMIRGAIPQVRQAASELPGQIIAGLNSMGPRKYALPVLGPVLAIRDGIERFGPQLKQAAMNLPGNIIAGLNSMGKRKYLVPILGPMLAIRDALTNPDEWKAAGAEIPHAIAAGVADAADAPVEAVSGVTGDIRAYLPFSPAEKGALQSLDDSGEALVSTLATGVESNQGQLTSAVSTALGATPLGMATTAAIDVTPQMNPPQLSVPAPQNQNQRQRLQEANARQGDQVLEPEVNVTIEEINVDGTGNPTDDVRRAAETAASESFDRFLRRISREI